MKAYKETTSRELSAIDIFNYATITGKRFEAHSQLKNENGLPGDSYIGIELKRGVWYWWMIFRGDRNYDTMKIKNNLNNYLYFDHRYNQNNAAVQKSWNKGYEARKIILQKVDYCNLPIGDN